MMKKLLMDVKGLMHEELFALNVNVFQAISLVCFAFNTVITVLVFSSRETFKDLGELRGVTSAVYITSWIIIFINLCLDSYCTKKPTNFKAEDEEKSGAGPAISAAAV